jgi:hypothetical protein
MPTAPTAAQSTSGITTILTASTGSFNGAKSRIGNPPPNAATSRNIAGVMPAIPNVRK